MCFQLPGHPSKVPLSVRDLEPHLTYDSLGPRESAVRKLAHNQFSYFYVVSAQHASVPDTHT